MFCPKCGTPHNDSDVFCARCGTRLGVSAPNGYESSATGTNAQDPNRFNVNGISDKHEFLRTNASMMAKIRVENAKKAKNISILIFALFFLFELLFITVVLLLIEQSRDGFTDLILPGVITVGLAVYLHVWLTKAVERLITEYVAIGAMTTILFSFAFIFNGNSAAVMAPLFIYIIVSTLWTIINLYRFNAEFHAQAPRMEDSVLMRQRNSLTKVIIFWALSVLFIVIEIALSPGISDTRGDDIEPMAAIVDILMFAVAQLVFAWLAYKITKTLRTGTEDKLTQVLHAISYIIIAVGWCTDVSFVSSVASAIWAK
ncbi:MAG: zinc ribbon domain-containing protein [Clostridia bacterium]|nr:zinc ribbon domain-containing protein [Clostridia bacterium]